MIAEDGQQYFLKTKITYQRFNSFWIIKKDNFEKIVKQLLTPLIFNVKITLFIIVQALWSPFASIFMAP